MLISWVWLTEAYEGVLVEVLLGDCIAEESLLCVDFVDEAWFPDRGCFFLDGFLFLLFSLRGDLADFLLDVQNRALSFLLNCEYLFLV